MEIDSGLVILRGITLEATMTSSEAVKLIRRVSKEVASRTGGGGGRELKYVAYPYCNQKGTALVKFHKSVTDANFYGQWRDKLRREIPGLTLHPIDNLVGFKTHMEIPLSQWESIQTVLKPTEMELVDRMVNLNVSETGLRAVLSSDLLAMAHVENVICFGCQREKPEGFPDCNSLVSVLQLGSDSKSLRTPNWEAQVNNTAVGTTPITNQLPHPVTPIAQTNSKPRENSGSHAGVSNAGTNITLPAQLSASSLSSSSPSPPTRSHSPERPVRPDTPTPSPVGQQGALGMDSVSTSGLTIERQTTSTVPPKDQTFANQPVSTSPSSPHGQHYDDYEENLIVVDSEDDDYEYSMPVRSRSHAEAPPAPQSVNQEQHKSPADSITTSLAQSTSTTVARQRQPTSAVAANQMQPSPAVVPSQVAQMTRQSRPDPGNLQSSTSTHSGTVSGASLASDLSMISDSEHTSVGDTSPSAFSLGSTSGATTAQTSNLGNSQTNSPTFHAQGRSGTLRQRQSGVPTLRPPPPPFTPRPASGGDMAKPDGTGSINLPGASTDSKEEPRVFASVLGQWQQAEKCQNRGGVKPPIPEKPAILQQVRLGPNSGMSASPSGLPPPYEPCGGAAAAAAHNSAGATPRNNNSKSNTPASTMIQAGATATFRGPSTISNDWKQKSEKEDCCTICWEPKDDPVWTPCAHSFCAKCLQQWINTGGRQCPTCRILLSTKGGLESMLDGGDGEWNEQKTQELMKKEIEELDNSSSDEMGEDREASMRALFEHLDVLLRDSD